jgi:hypothetical protein
MKRPIWKYLGHVLRMDKERLPRLAYNWTPVGTRRRRRRPRKTQIIRESVNINVNTYDLQELAKDRQC